MRANLERESLEKASIEAKVHQLEQLVSEQQSAEKIAAENEQLKLQLAE